MPTQVLAVEVVYEGNSPAGPLPDISNILGPICPDCSVDGNKAFLDIRDAEVFEKCYKKCLETKKEKFSNVP